MQKNSNGLLWLLLIGVIVFGGAYIYKLKSSGDNRPLDISSEVRNPVLTGQMSRISMYEPRKSMPSGVFLQNLEKTTSMQNLKGQWTLVNLWASWCPPCLRELPGLQRLNDAYAGQGFRVVAISVDTLDSPADLDNIIATRRLGPIARNWDHTGELFKLVSNVSNNGAIPMSFIVDPDGKVFGQLNGEADWATLDGLAFVDSLLGRNNKTPTRK